MRYFIVWSVIVLSSLSAGTATQAETDPYRPILSLGGFYYNISFTDHQGRYKLPFVFPDLVAAELLQNYECLPVDRGRNLDTATETGIRAISSIQELYIPYENYATADYAIKASLAAKPGEDGFRGHVFINDLQRGHITEVPLTAPTLAAFPKIAASCIAKALSLSAVSPRANQTATCTNLNYAVITPLLFDTTITTTQAIDAIENVLLSDSYPLLERGQFQSVLDEQVILALSSNNPTAFQLMRLLDADRLIELSAARWFDTTYLTLKLIDTHTALIVDAASATSNEENVLSTIKQLAAKLNYKAPSASIPTDLSSARKQEALFLLSKEYDPKRTSYGREDLAARWVNGITASETAVMLCHKDERFIHTIATNLARYMEGMICDWNTEDSSLGRRVPRLDRATSLICAILQNDPSPDDLLICAEVCAYSGNKKLAQKFFRQASNQSRAPEKKRQLRVKAWLVYLDGDYQQTHKLISEFQNKYDRDNVNANTLIGRVNVILARQANDEERFNYLDDLIFRSHGFPTPEAIDEYLVLYRKKNGPQATLKMIDKHKDDLDHSYRGELTLLLNEARCRLEMKDYVEASRLSLDLFDSASRLKQMYHDGWCTDYYLERCAEIRRQIPKEYAYPDRPWKRGVEVRALPKDQYIYIIPLGDTHLHLIHSIVGQVKYFWGNNVKEGPALALPESLLEKNNPGKKDYRIHPADLMNYLSTHAEIPDDALFIAYVTREPLIFGQGAHIYCTVAKPSDIKDRLLLDNPVVVSYYFGGADGRDPVTAHRIAWRINALFRASYIKKVPSRICGMWLPQCSNFPCIFFDEINSGNGSTALPAMCEECQQDYLNADFEEIKGALKTNLTPGLFTPTSSQNSEF